MPAAASSAAAPAVNPREVHFNIGVWDHHPDSYGRNVLEDADAGASSDTLSPQQAKSVVERFSSDPASCLPTRVEVGHWDGVCVCVRVCLPEKNVCDRGG